MPHSRVCSRCGAEVSGYSAEGLCPKCMLLGGLDHSALEAAAPLGASPVVCAEPDSAPPASPAERLRYFGDYELLEEIARGGMGVVYRARQVSLNRIVAVKMILAGQLATADALRRFLAEAEAAANLRHPNIVGIYEVGEHHGQHYFSMEYVEGQNLAAVVREKPLPAAQAARYVRALAEAAQYAHERGTLHRDLKPSNVLLDAFDRPRITDFGLAKQRGPAEETPCVAGTKGAKATSTHDEHGQPPTADLTLSGQVLGTPSFMPPEQAAGRRDAVGPASDIYALGAILYHLVTARPPFVAEHPAETLRLVLEAEPVSPRLLNPGLPRDLETICLKCLEKTPAKRYPAAQALAEELGRFLRGEPIQARPVGAPERLWRWCRRKPLVAALSASLIFVLLAGFAGVLGQWRRAEVNAANETTQRHRTEQANLNLELQRAESLLGAGDVPGGLGRLARLLRQHPTHQPLAERLLFALNQRTFPLPLTPPLQHQAAVLDAQFSPDGLRVVTASADSTARVWDALTGKPITGPLSHEAAVRCASFSPDGHWVLTASKDKTARVWDAQTGVPMGAPLRHEDDVRTAQFSPDGTRVVTASSDHTARIWETDSSRLVATIVHRQAVHCAEFSPDGQSVATASADATVGVWDARTGKGLARSYNSSRVWVQQVHFSPDGEHLVTSYGWSVAVLDAHTCRLAGASLSLNHFGPSVQFHPSGRGFIAVAGTIAGVWPTQTNQPLLRVEHKGHIRSAEFSADGLVILTASQDKTAMVWDARTGQPLGEPMRQRGEMNRARFSPDGQRVVTASSDRTARIWDVRHGQPLPMTWWHETGTLSAHFSPDGQQLLTAGKDGFSDQVDLRSGRAVTFGTTASSSLTAAQYAPDGRRIVTIGSRAKVWNARSGELWGEPFAAVRDQAQIVINSVEFSPDSERVVTTSADQTANIWEVETGNLMARPLPHQGNVYYAQFSGDGLKVATASGDGTARIWDARTGEPLTEPLGHEARVNRARFSADTRRLLTASVDETARIWDSATGKELFRLRHDNDVVDAAFSPDGTRLLTASRDTTARLWDGATGQPLGEALKHSAQVTAARFSPDGERVITGSADHTARLWSARTGQPLTDAFAFDDIINEVEFSPDGQRVVVASDDGWAKVWEAPRAPLPVPEWLPALAECLAGQRFNEAGFAEATRPEELLSLKGQLVHLSGTDFFSTWARWFFADRSTRSVAAGSPRLVAEYVAGAIQWDLLSSVREAARLAPTNGLALARLARVMMKSERSISNTLEEIEFLSGRAVQMSSGDDEAWRVRALVLESMGKLALALDAIGRALSLAPGKDYLWNTQGLMLAQTNQLDAALRCFSRAIELKQANPKLSRTDLTQYRSNRCELLKRMGRMAEAARDNLAVYGIPARDPQARPELLDLSAFYNVNLTNEWTVNSDLRFNGLTPLPGLARLAGVDFDARGAMQVAITERGRTFFPHAVADIPIGRALSRIHFLHAAVVYDSKDRIRIGHYLIHYADGQEQEIPLINGKQIGAWFDPIASEAEVAWQGIDPVRPKGQRVHLYKFTWQNPHPQTEIRSLDLISAGTNAAPFVVGITVE